MKHLFTAFALLAGLSLSGAAQAALHDRGGGLIYDDDLNVTWLQDANYAKTSGFDFDGLMTWDEANTWANNLAFSGYDDWRLPKVSPINGATFEYTYSPAGDTDVGYNITSPNSELAYMFKVNLANLSHYNADGTQSGCFTTTSNCLDNTGPFENLQAAEYWSGTEYAAHQNSAWSFGMHYGDQRANGTEHIFYAWAVRDGDVAAIPEPETYTMLLAGLLLVGWSKHRQIKSDQGA